MGEGLECPLGGKFCRRASGWGSGATIYVTKQNIPVMVVIAVPRDTTRIVTGPGRMQFSVQFTLMDRVIVIKFSEKNDSLYLFGKNKFNLIRFKLKNKTSKNLNFKQTNI